MTPIDESRSDGFRPKVPMSPATTTRRRAPRPAGCPPTSRPADGAGEGELAGAVHGEGHGAADHERPDEAAAGGHQKGGFERVLCEAKLEVVADAHQ